MKKACKAEPKSHKKPGSSLKKKASNQPKAGPKTKSSVQPARSQQAPAVPTLNGLPESDDDDLYVGTVITTMPHVSTDVLTICPHSFASPSGAHPLVVRCAMQAPSLQICGMSMLVAVVRIDSPGTSPGSDRLACVHPQ